LKSIAIIRCAACMRLTVYGAASCRGVSGSARPVRGGRSRTGAVRRHEAGR